MDQNEFKLFFKNKSPLLYTYLLELIISSKVADEMLFNIFARFYLTRTAIPATFSREKWLILISKKFMVDYFQWRTTEEGQKLQDVGLTSFQCSHLVLEHQTQLNTWIQDCSEEEQATINELIMQDLPETPTRFSLKEEFAKRLKKMEEKYGKPDSKK